MTSDDRHSDYNSPYRTGRHVPLGSGRNSMLTSVASDSRADITSPYRDDGSRASTTHDLHAPTSPFSPQGHRPYSPGLRSSSAQNLNQNQDGFEVQRNAQGDVPMQSFQDGLPPPPPAQHSWRRIDAWAEENYPELFDQLCEGATANDLNELEHVLDCTLPQDVRESLMIHDGQERGGMPTGILFSSMLLDCEEIVQEWDNWRKVNQDILYDTSLPKPPVPPKSSIDRTSTGSGSTNGEASSSRSAPPPSVKSDPNSWKQELLGRQECFPPNMIRKVYSHPAWIPLARDWGGNNLAVDLAPGPQGSWGQVILFGRDYDTKYVVARSWASLLAVLADDMNSGRWYVDEDSNELKLREFKEARIEPAYFDILRWRTDQKYGRRAAQRRSMAPPGRGSPARGGSPTASPYASPTEPSSNSRGRPTQRRNGHSPLASPNRPIQGTLSPLAIVSEEAPATADAANILSRKLVEVETPRPSEDSEAAPKDSIDKGKGVATPLSSKMNGKLPEVEEGTMKTIEI
ncbi:related to 1,3-beta-glucan synthase [Cephalotrichum gorgonifer]|uniref:Related to 1,3-beta-glucan synthase n=1 Tax=Cephalotrichum gorgonifer TaxID=2041049 RepID=A0AAE8MW43_9PEZI|nr:related to 1,3-beta-glucan synthase [Cephalotrichum gorgonifer]